MVGIGSGIPKWEDRTEVEREHFRKKIDNDFVYLHSQGVVIKVDGELPELLRLEADDMLKAMKIGLNAGGYAFQNSEPYRQMGLEQQAYMIVAKELDKQKVKCVAVEPLIREVANAIQN